MGGSNAEKWGDLKKKKFFISNSVEAIISFKLKHQGLSKHVLAIYPVDEFFLFLV